MSRVGDWVWIPVTDHPDYPHQIREGSPYSHYATQAEAQSVCDAWNSYGPVYHWYPIRTQILPALRPGNRMNSQPGGPRLPGL